MCISVVARICASKGRILALVQSVAVAHVGGGDRRTLDCGEASPIFREFSSGTSVAPNQERSDCQTLTAISRRATTYVVNPLLTRLARRQRVLAVPTVFQSGDSSPHSKSQFGGAHRSTQKGICMWVVLNNYRFLRMRLGAQRSDSASPRLPVGLSFKTRRL